VKIASEFNRGATTWFIDETKTKQYVMVAAVVDSADLDSLRRAMRAHLRGGQRAIHFNAESPSRRRVVMATIAASPVVARVYRTVTRIDDKTAREMSLRQIARDARNQTVQRLVLESDDSLVASDRRWLFQELGPRSIEYVHLPKRADPLLWVRIC
jgi:hypothetical protein